MKKILQKILFQILWSLKNIIVHPQNSLFHLPGLFLLTCTFAKKNQFVMLLRTLTRSKEQTAIWMKPSNFFWVKNTTTRNAIPIFFCLLGLFKNVQILSIWLWLHIDTVSRVFRFSFFGYSFAVAGHFFVQWSMGRMGWDATFIRYAGDCNWNCFNFHLMVWLCGCRLEGGFDDGFWAWCHLLFIAWHAWAWHIEILWGYYFNILICIFVRAGCFIFGLIFCRCVELKIESFAKIVIGFDIRNHFECH